jgi:hypothetical protein
MAYMNDFMVLVIVGGLFYFLSTIAHRLRQATALLESLDGELFHIAQELNPHYGLCSSCDKRGYVRHVELTGEKPNQFTPDVFYCSRCLWLSGTVAVADDEKHYKDRFTEDDYQAGLVGPGFEEE